MFTIFDMYACTKKDGKFSPKSANQTFFSSLHSGVVQQGKLKCVGLFLHFFNTIEFKWTLKFKRKVHTGIKIHFLFFPKQLRHHVP